jgi:hypothetical protein
LVLVPVLLVVLLMRLVVAAVVEVLRARRSGRPLVPNTLVAELDDAAVVNPVVNPVVHPARL